MRTAGMTLPPSSFRWTELQRRLYTPTVTQTHPVSERAVYGSFTDWACSCLLCFWEAEGQMYINFWPHRLATYPTHSSCLRSPPSLRHPLPPSVHSCMHGMKWLEYSPSSCCLCKKSTHESWVSSQKFTWTIPSSIFAKFSKIRISMFLLLKD